MSVSVILTLVPPGVVGSNAFGETVRVAAPEPYADLVQAWGTAAGIEVQVRSFDSNECVRRTGRGEFDLALIAESLSEGQKRSLAAQPGAVPQIYAVGWEAATLIVHPENPLLFIDQEWGRYLFLVQGCNERARVHLWNELPGPATFSKNPIGKILPRFESSEGIAVREILMGEDCGLDEEAYQVAEDAARERIVAASPEAVGVVYRLRHIGMARPLPVLTEGRSDPAVPSSETLNSGAYPFGRKIWMAAPKLYYPPHPASQLTTFALSPAGQFEVARLGFFPLR